MTFRVGQKVVCISTESSPYESLLGTIEPSKGDIGTVTNVYVARLGAIVIELLEWPQPGGKLDGMIYEPGWLAEDFRPLTDISFAHEILRKVTRKNRVPA